MTTPAPKALRSATFALYGQSLLGIAGGVIILVLIGSVHMTEEDGAGQLRFVAVVGLVIGVIQFVGAILLRRGLRWVRVTVLVIEFANVALGLEAIIQLSTAGESFQPTSVISLVLSFLVIQPLLRPEVRSWFAGDLTPQR
ncbi:hypothetical protein [Amycolatopsis sp. GM8]|uniref:hypothetical protein n=1 Tax=Amycolatopsis sp. GM8 TaxID=2896530 RepID=UPI001F31240C|nr:hypothetical protein [Amycolatopsis sp. GM8]